MSVYLHVLVTSDPAQFIHGHDVETLAEYSPLNFDCLTVSCQAEGTLPPATAAAGDTSKPSQECSSWDAYRTIEH